MIPLKYPRLNYADGDSVPVTISCTQPVLFFFCSSRIIRFFPGPADKASFRNAQEYNESRLRCVPKRCRHYGTTSGNIREKQVQVGEAMSQMLHNQRYSEYSAITIYRMERLSDVSWQHYIRHNLPSNHIPDTTYDLE